MPTYTLQTIQSRIYSQLDGNTGFYPSAQVTGVINEGLRRLNLLCGFNVATLSVPGFTVANQLVYLFPSGILTPQRVYCEGRELSPFSLRQLATSFRNWAVDTNSSGPTSRWAPIDINQFVIHPLDATGGRLLEVNGVAPMTALVNAADVVSLDDEFVDILVDYGRSRIMFKEGGKPFADASLAYQQMIRKVKTMILWAGMKWPGYWIVNQLEKSEGRAA